jgi:hypothetical protein
MIDALEILRPSASPDPPRGSLAQQQLGEYEPSRPVTPVISAVRSVGSRRIERRR